MYNELNDFKVKINECEGTMTICGLNKNMKTLHKINIAPSYKFQGVDYKVVGLANMAIFSKLTTEINLPETITKIGLHAFDNTTNLCNINVDAKNEKYCSVDGVLFNKGMSILIKFPTKSLVKEYEVPDSVRSIKEGAFENAFYVEKITMSDKVQLIGPMAFQGCKFVSEIRVSDKIDRFDRRLFNGCANLKKVNVPKNLKKIAAYVFANCHSLDFKVPKEVDAIGVGAFCNSGISSFYLPSESKINFFHDSVLKDIELDLFYVDVPTLLSSKETSITGKITNFVIGKNFDYETNNFTRLFGHVHGKIDVKNLFVFCEEKEFKGITPALSYIFTSKGVTQIFLQNIESLEEKGYDYGQINQILKGYDKGILLNALPTQVDVGMMRNLISVSEKDKKVAFNLINDIRSAEKIINPIGKAEKYGNINRIISEMLSEDIERSER